MPDPEPQPGALSWAQRVDGRVRRHPVVAVVGLVLAPVIFLSSATGAVSWLYGSVRDVVDPHREEIAALDALDLDTRPAFFEQTFGVARESVELCAQGECPGDPPADLRMFIHRTDDLTVRAVFEGEQLAMYLVTLASGDVSPPVRWLGYELGDLGRVTFADALAPASGVRPTDQDLFLGPQSTAYAEVVAAGAPASYRGLVLAWAPDGYGGDPLRFDGASASVADREIRAGAETGGAALETFRSSSTPNTWGEFRDDGGYLATLVHDAEQVRVLLYAGTEL
jgi:hypothetical protein